MKSIIWLESEIVLSRQDVLMWRMIHFHSILDSRFIPGDLNASEEDNFDALETEMVSRAKWVDSRAYSTFWETGLGMRQIPIRTWLTNE